MRKIAITAILLALLSITVITAVYCSVSREKDTVTVTEETLWGSPKNAEDCRVSMKFRDTGADNSWTLSFTGQEGVFPAETVFSAKPKTKETQTEKIYGHFSLQPYSGSSYYEGDDIAYEDAPIMKPIFLDAVKKTAAGNGSNKSYRLSDYMKYLPLELSTSDWANIPGSIQFNESAESFSGFDIPYFDIPVPDDIFMQVTVKKSADGQVDQLGFQHDYERSGGYYELRSAGAAAADSCFLALDRLLRVDNETGRSANTNLLPSKSRGIHYIPLKKDVDESGNRYLDMENARRVLTLAEDARLLNLRWSCDQQNLLLFTEEQGFIIVRILAEKDGNPGFLQVKQKLKLLKTDGTVNPMEVHLSAFDTCTLLYHNTKAVFLYEENGRWQKISEDLQFLQNDGDGSMPFGYENIASASVAGGRAALLIMEGMIYTDDPEYYKQTINHYLLTADRTGLLYCGKYRISLQSDSFPESLSQIVADTDSDGAFLSTVKWEVTK